MPHFNTEAPNSHRGRAATAPECSHLKGSDGNARGCTGGASHAAPPRFAWLTGVVVDEVPHLVILQLLTKLLLPIVCLPQSSVLQIFLQAICSCRHAHTKVAADRCEFGRSR